MGEVFIFVGPSGVGKTTLANLLMAWDPNIKPVPSHTTREQRTTETEGIDYYFIEPWEFSLMETRGDFLAYSTVYENSYGTSKALVYEKLRKGHDVLLVLDYKGLQDTLEVLPDAVSIFIAPPAQHVLEQRLKARGTDSFEVVQKRLAIAANELKKARNLRHLVINDCLECALQELKDIVVEARAEHSLP